MTNDLDVACFLLGIALRNEQAIKRREQKETCYEQAWQDFAKNAKNKKYKVVINERISKNCN